MVVVGVVRSPDPFIGVSLEEQLSKFPAQLLNVARAVADAGFLQGKFCYSTVRENFRNHAHFRSF